MFLHAVINNSVISHSRVRVVQYNEYYYHQCHSIVGYLLLLGRSTIRKRVPYSSADFLVCRDGGISIFSTFLGLAVVGRLATHITVPLFFVAGKERKEAATRQNQKLRFLAFSETHKGMQVTLY